MERLNAGLQAGLEGVNLDKNILLAREKGKSCQPILLLNGFVSERPGFGRKHSCRDRELRASDLASDGARSDSHLGIVPDTLVFPRIAACHHIELVVNQTGVATAAPLLRNVVRLRYF